MLSDKLNKLERKSDYFTPEGVQETLARAKKYLQTVKKYTTPKEAEK